MNSNTSLRIASLCDKIADLRSNGIKLVSDTKLEKIRAFFEKSTNKNHSVEYFKDLSILLDEVGVENFVKQLILKEAHKVFADSAPEAKVNKTNHSHTPVEYFSLNKNSVGMNCWFFRKNGY